MQNLLQRTGIQRSDPWREKGELVTRQLLYLSGGTADQVYLAVRLAICRLALGEDVPIVLDDALVRFDDERMRAALTLLRDGAGDAAPAETPAESGGSFPVLPVVLIVIAVAAVALVLVLKKKRENNV